MSDIMANMQDSRITLEMGATPTAKEVSIASFLIENNFTDRVHFLRASMIKGVRTPDAVINGLKWEMKTPIGKSSNTMKRAFKVAIGQSVNSIFDLRRSSLPDQVNVPKLKKEFYDIKKARRMVIITKTKRVLTYSK